MEWRSHALVGAAAAPALLLVAGVHGLPELVAAAAAGALGALVPDLDHQASKGRQILDASAIAAAFLVVYLSGCASMVCIPSLDAIRSMAAAALGLLGAYFVFFTLFRPAHRGITHSLAACAAFGALAYFLFGWELGLAGFAGYASHLLADNEIKLL